MLILLLTNLVLFCVGVWVGYRMAQAKHVAEIEELKNQPVKVKVVRSHVVPLSIKKKITSSELQDGGVDALLSFEEQMLRELAGSLKPYIMKYSREDRRNGDFEMKHTLLVVPPERGVDYE